MNGIGRKTGQATECQAPFSAIALAADSAEAAMSPKMAVSIPVKKTFTPSITRPGGPTHANPHFSPDVCGWYATGLGAFTVGMRCPMARSRYTAPFLPFGGGCGFRCSWDQQRIGRPWGWGGGSPKRCHTSRNNGWSVKLLVIAAHTRRSDTRTSVDVRRAELRRQQVIPAEHVQRQVAVRVVIAVEEPAFLLSVQRVVGRVEVQGDGLRRCAM
jgi:hypothetical protein